MAKTSGEGLGGRERRDRGERKRVGGGRIRREGKRAKGREIIEKWNQEKQG